MIILPNFRGTSVFFPILVNYSYAFVGFSSYNLSKLLNLCLITKKIHVSQLLDLIYSKVRWYLRWYLKIQINLMYDKWIR